MSAKWSKRIAIKGTRIAIGKVPIIKSTETCQYPGCHRQHFFPLLLLFAMGFFVFVVTIEFLFSLWYRNNIFYDRMKGDLLTNTNWFDVSVCIQYIAHTITGKLTFRQYEIRIPFPSRENRKQIEYIDRLLNFRHYCVQLSSYCCCCCYWEKSIDIIKNCNSHSLYMIVYMILNAQHCNNNKNKWRINCSIYCCICIRI